MDELALWSRRGHLMLVNGDQNESRLREIVTRCAANLLDGGYLVFTNYREDYRGVQIVVDELLTDPTYRVVAYARGLVALTTVTSTPFEAVDDRGMTTPWGLR